MEKVGSFVSPSDGDSSSSSIPASSVSVSSPQAVASDSESLVDPAGAVCFARNGGAASLHTVSGRAFLMLEDTRQATPSDLWRWLPSRQSAVC